jgi:hypothetical protein
LSPVLVCFFCFIIILIHTAVGFGYVYEVLCYAIAGRKNKEWYIMNPYSYPRLSIDVKLVFKWWWIYAMVLSKRENIILLNNGAVNVIYDDIDNSNCLYVKGDFKGFGLQSF